MLLFCCFVGRGAGPHFLQFARLLRSLNGPFSMGAFCVQVVTYDSIAAKRSGIMLNASKRAYRTVLYVDECVIRVK